MIDATNTYYYEYSRLSFLRRRRYFSEKKQKKNEINSIPSSIL